jgi:hypothetical protein
MAAGMLVVPLLVNTVSLVFTVRIIPPLFLISRPAPTGSVPWLVLISNPGSAPRRVGRTNLRSDALLVFQMAEVAVPRELFRDILKAIERLKLATVLSG